MPRLATAASFIAGAALAAAIAASGCGGGGSPPAAVVTRLPVPAPTALAAAGAFVFVGQADGTVTRRSVRGEVTATARLGGRVSHLLIAGDTLVAVVAPANEVVVLRQEDLARVRRARPVDGPGGAITAVAYDGQIVIADAPGHRVLRLGERSLKVLRTFPLPGGAVPASLAANRDAYVATTGATRAAVRLGFDDGTVRVRPLPVLGGGPCGIAVYTNRNVTVVTATGIATLQPGTVDHPYALPVEGGVRGIVGVSDDSALVTAGGHLVDVGYDGRTRVLADVPEGAVCGTTGIVGEVWLLDTAGQQLVRVRPPE
ncbi:MAG: hypothetical protein U0237_13135 [Thermoleophilia bacterium]